MQAGIGEDPAQRNPHHDLFVFGRLVEVQCVRTRAVVQRHVTGGQFRAPTVLFHSTAPFGLHVRQQILLVGTRDELPGRRTREASARTVEISKSVKLACTIWPANVPGPVGAADSCTKVSQIRSRQYSNARIGATAEVAPLSLRYRMAGNRNSTPAFGAAAGWRRRRATVESPLCRGVAHRYRSR
jgi:hypothetical protein